MFNLDALPEDARFFDWEDKPVVTSADLSEAYIAFPSGLAVCNPSDVRNKAGETDRRGFDYLREALVKCYQNESIGEVTATSRASKDQGP